MWQLTPPLSVPTEGPSHGKGPPQSYNESGYHSFAEASLDPNSFEARQNALNSPQASPRWGGEEDGGMSSNQRWAQIKKQQQYKDQERFEPEPASSHRPPGSDGLSPRMAQHREDGQASPRMSQVSLSWGKSLCLLVLCLGSELWQNSWGGVELNFDGVS